MPFQCLLAICFVVLLFSCKTKPSKNYNLIGIWVSPTSAIGITDTLGKSSNYLWTWYGYNADHYFSLSHDSITFNPERGNDAPKFQGGIKCKILQNSDSFLYLLPLKDDAKQLLLSNSKLKFIRKEFLVDPSIKLEKIIFHSSPCFGRCPVFDVEIDSNMLIYFKGHIINDYHDSTLRPISEQFKGKLPDSTYKKLISLLQRCELKDLKYTPEHNTDAWGRTIIVYFNNQRKEISSTSPPMILTDLVNFFVHINNEVTLTATNENFEIERGYQFIPVPNPLPSK